MNKYISNLINDNKLISGIVFVAGVGVLWCLYDQKENEKKLTDAHIDAIKNGRNSTISFGEKSYFWGLIKLGSQKYDI